MPTDPSNVAALLARIAHAGTAFSQPDSPAASERSRGQLLRAAGELLIALREPQENLYHIATQVPKTTRPGGQMLTDLRR